MSLILTYECGMLYAEVAYGGLVHVWEVGDGWPPNLVSGEDTPLALDALVAAMGLLARIIDKVQLDAAETKKEDIPCRI